MPDVLFSVRYPYLPPPVEGPPDTLTEEARLTIAFQALLGHQIVFALHAVDGDEYDGETEITVGGGFTPFWHHNRQDFEVIFLAPTAPRPGPGERDLRQLTPAESESRRARLDEIIRSGLSSFLDEWCARNPSVTRPSFATAVMLLDSSGSTVSKTGEIESWGYPT